MYLEDVAELLRQRADDIRRGYEGGSPAKFEAAANSVDEAIDLIKYCANHFDFDAIVVEEKNDD